MHWCKNNIEAKKRKENPHQSNQQSLNDYKGAEKRFNMLNVCVCVCVYFSTFQLKHRLVCVAASRVRLEGCVSGAACRVWIILEGALIGLEPTMFTCRILNLVRTESIVTGTLRWFYTTCSVYLSRGAPVSLWKQLYNVYCGSGGCPPKFEKITLMMS